jgi:hypothetical protein
MNYTIREKVDNGGTVGWFRHFLGRAYAARNDAASEPPRYFSAP